MRFKTRVRRGAVPAVLAVAGLALALSISGNPGEVRSGDRYAYALTGAKVIAAPGRVIENGVVVVRGGVIEAVGPQGTAIPADARVFDLKGKVVHAAFVDPYVPADRLAGRRPRGPSDDEEGSEAPGRGAAAGAAAGTPAALPNPAHAEERVVDTLRVQDRVADTYRRLGFGAVAAVPPSGTLRGRGAIVSLQEGPMEARILSSQSGQYISLEPERFDFANFARAVYPSSKMGAVAMTRQAFATANWWRDAEAAYAKHPAGQSRPRRDAGAEAMVPAAEGKEPVFFEATDVLSLLRAGKIAREYKLRAVYVGAGDEYRLRDQVAAIKPDLVLKVDFPRPYRLEDEAEWIDVPLERLRRIDRAPSNPKWLRDAGVTFSFTTAGLENAEDFNA